MNDDLHEIAEQITWFRDLLDTIDVSRGAVIAAIKLLERQLEEQGKSRQKGEKQNEHSKS